MVPSLIVLFLISFINSSIYEIGTFPSDWKLSIRQPIADAENPRKINTVESPKTKNSAVKTIF